MADKKADTRFTIQFNRSNPAHTKAVDILNSLGKRGKAQYIASAVLHYESCGETHETKHPMMVDEQTIEAVVYRILRNRDDGTAKPSADISNNRQAREPEQGKDMECNGDLESLGEAEISAVAGSLEMFRRK